MTVKKEITDNQLDSWFQTVTKVCGGDYCLFRFDILRYLGDSDATIVHTYLANLCRMKKSNRSDREIIRKNRFWMKCPAKDIQEDLRMSPNVRRRAFEVLKQAKLVAFKRSSGNILWVKLLQKQLNLIESGEAGTFTFTPSSKETALLHSSKETALPESKKVNYSPIESTTNSSVKSTPNNPTNNLCGVDVQKPFKPSTDDKGYHLAKELLRMLNKHKKILRQPKLTHWAKEFDHLLTVRTFKQVYKAIERYGDHIEDKFFPKCYAAKSFCAEFVRIEAAINRLDGSLPIIETNDVI